MYIVLLKLSGLTLLKEYAIPLQIPDGRSVQREGHQGIPDMICQLTQDHQLPHHRLP